MEPASRFIYGALFMTALVGTAYIVTAHHAWDEVALGVLVWAGCGAALVTSLDAVTWWIVWSDARKHAPTPEPQAETPVIAGRIGPAAIINDTDVRRAA